MICVTYVSPINNWVKFYLLILTRDITGNRNNPHKLGLCCRKK